MSMRLLVTGGAGFIGSRFVDKCLTDKAMSNMIKKLVVVDKLTYAGNYSNISDFERDRRFQFIHADINDRDVVGPHIASSDWVVNFAAESHVDRSLSDPTEFIASNFVGVFNLLEMVKKSNNVKFLQVSTDEVYGTILEGSWDEQSPLQPRSPYSASKASADLLVMAYVTSFGIDARITRCSNNFGPKQHPEKMIPTIIQHLNNGTEIPVYGDGNNVRDWLFVDDHVLGIWLTMLNGKPGNVYNLGGGVEYSNNDLIIEISKNMGIEFPRLKYVQDRKGHDFRYSLSYEKAKREIGYAPRFEFGEAIQLLIQKIQ
jgi:dTDP-glucose 4,6-dehydratase